MGKNVDLDAKLPLAYGFQKRGYEVVFLAWGTLSKDPSKLTQIDKVLSKKGSKFTLWIAF